MGQMGRKDSRVDREFGSFFKDLLLYVGTRLRQLAIAVVILLDLALSAVTGIKKFVMRHVFWGRGSWYRYSVVAVMVIAVFILPLALYRDPLTQEIYAEDAPVQSVSEIDLIVERGSSQTLIPKGRTRMEILTYTVTGGDTLSSIAERNKVSVQTLLWANNMSETDFIRPGQSIKIPPADGVIHSVKSGDTLSFVANKYDAAEQAIVDLNKSLWDGPPFDLTVGEVLFVPNGTMPPPPAPPVTIASTSSASVGVATGTYYTGGAAGPAAPSAGRFLGWPVAGGSGIVTQCASAWHPAVDIADSSAPSLVAAAAGTVIFAGMSDPWGYAWSVQVDHGNGFTTWYAHMSVISVSSGQYVGKGQVIGRMGATGLATGTHVHFELRNGVSWTSRINPAPYMERHVCGY